MVNVAPFSLFLFFSPFFFSCTPGGTFTVYIAGEFYAAVFLIGGVYPTVDFARFR